MSRFKHVQYHKRHETMKMSQIVKQIKVVISCPSDVDKEKDIIVRLCDTTFESYLF